MKMLAVCFVLLGAACFAGTAVAAGTGMKPGLWEITTTTEMPGMPFQPPPTKVKQCYTKDDLKDQKEVLPKQEGECRITDVKESGNRVTWKVVCSGEGGGKGSGEMVFKGENEYAGSMRFDMEGMTMTSRYAGKRIGDCK